MSYGAPPPRPAPKRSWLLIIAVVLVVVVLVIGVTAFLFPPPPNSPIQVTDINIWAPDNVCGLNSNPSYYSGFNGSTSQVQVIDFGVPNFNGTSCTIHSVTTNTTGFTLSAIQEPLNISANGNASMNITVESPSTDFSGFLNLVFA